MRYLKSIFFSVIILFSLICCSEKSEMDVFVDDLLSRMTVEEKIGQMHQLAPGRAGMEAEWLREAVRKGEIGTMLAPGEPALLNEVQRFAVEESRLGIPLIYAHDVIHGYKTVFPIPLGLAATFNPAIVEKGSEIAAMEARSAGMRWTFAPMVDVSRDPRWGRIAESFGEDPYMNAVMGVATVRGFQKDTTSEYLNVAACAKHFVGYGAAEGGKDYNTTHVTEDQLRDVYLAPFKALADESFRYSFGYTALYALVSLVLINVLAFTVAYALTQKIKGANLFRTVFFMPNLIGGIVLGYIWSMIFDGILSRFGTSILLESRYGFWGLIILMCWQQIGYMMIIYIAGLQAVPEDMLEAAKIDGARSDQTLFRVIIPNVMPSVTICTFLSLTNGFKLFDQNLALTGGLPYIINPDGTAVHTTEMLALNIYNTFYLNSKSRGVGQAKAVLFFILVAAIAIIQLRATRSKEVQQ